MYRSTRQIPPRSPRRLVAAYERSRLGKIFQLHSHLVLEIVEKSLAVQFVSIHEVSNPVSDRNNRG